MTLALLIFLLLFVVDRLPHWVLIFPMAEVLIWTAAEAYKGVACGS